MAELGGGTGGEGAPPLRLPSASPPLPAREAAEEEGAGGGCSPLRWGVSGRGGAGGAGREAAAAATGVRLGGGRAGGLEGREAAAPASLPAGRTWEGGGWASPLGFGGEEVPVTLFRFPPARLASPVWAAAYLRGGGGGADGGLALPRVVGAGGDTHTHTDTHRDTRGQVAPGGGVVAGR